MEPEFIEKKKGLKFERVFTKDNNPYEMFDYDKRTSTIRNTDGSVVYEMKDIEVPKQWSQVATDILAQKYIRKKGVPILDSEGKPKRDETGKIITGAETSVKQVAHRMANCWTQWGKRNDYFDSEEDAKAFYNETAYMILNQMAAPNSPQWFNTGLAESYGITGSSQGHYYVDQETEEVKLSEDAYTRPQPHACAEYHTSLYTDEGTKYIGEVVEKNMTNLKVFDGEKYVKVLATKYNGEREVFRLKLKNGNYIDLTDDHLILSSEKRKKDGGSYDWKHVKNVKVNDNVQEYVESELKEEQIVSIDKVGVKKVYDIQTESEKFLGNGIVIHNCFIQSVKDDLVNEGGIFDLVTREARIFKYGSGTGTNFSNIRGKGEKLSGGGRSSGLMSFLKIFDTAAGAIKSGGTTRRAAKMVCLDLDHPEIEEFIEWKMKEEQKVAALVTGSQKNKYHLNKIMEAAVKKKSTSVKENLELRKEISRALKEEVPINYVQRVLQLVKQGKTNIDIIQMDTHYESEAYTTVAGQNSNNSIRIPNEFFQKLQTNSEWELKNRKDGEVFKKVDAGELWDKITYSAWMSADPGVQYDTTINEWHTCKTDGPINGSNPCSEYMFLDDTACNLASLNLVKFYDKEKGQFEVYKYKHAIRIWTTILEISVLMAQFPSKEVALNSYNYRTLGLGYANLGSLLMMTGHAYDSEEGRSIAGALAAIMGGESYATSAELAGILGPFKRYEENKEHMLRVIKNHRRAAHNVENSEYEGLTIKPIGINHNHCPSNISEAAKQSWDKALTIGERNGFRNAQVTVIAPTGTIGLVMDCDTTGVEPDFALVKFKKLAGGGYFKIVNQSVPQALRNLKYSEEEIKEIINYATGHGNLKESPEINYDTLKEKGFTDEKIEAVEQQLPTSFELKFAFNKWALGEDFLKDIGFTEEQLENPMLNVLEALGFTKSQISKAEEYVCGTMTLEGAPHLKQEHYKVFDCANKCGKKGSRYITPKGHIKMMAAVQPFISGAISKTINMDKNASIKEVSDAYMESWKLMIKAVALYRDESKLSQPLNASTEDETELLMLKEEDDIDETITPQKVQENIIKHRKMPAKRYGFVQEASVGGQKVYLRTGEFEDGSLGEIFLDTYKEGASYGALLNCFAVAVSKGLQYGVPLEEFVDSFTFTRFEPSGPVRGHPAIKNSTSIVDYLFRSLGYEYLGRTDFVHVKSMESMDHKEREKNETPKDKQLRLDEKKEKTSKKDSSYLDAKSKGYSGDQCRNCGSMKMRRNGNCMICDECGETTGCS